MAKESKADQLNDMWKNARVPDDLDLTPPGENKTIPLDRTLAEEFRDLKRNASKNVVKMALLAQGVRATNKNQSGDYTKAFHEWYAEFKMENLFGSKSNFTKYAQAGEVIVKHKADLGREISQLPLSVSALYAIHDMTDEEVSLCLEDHYTRTNITVADKSQFKKQSKKPQPVINPNATAASITTWLKKWRNPPVPSTEKRRLEFTTIKADTTVFDFDKSEGSFAGQTTVEQLKAIHEKIVVALKGEDVHVSLSSKILGHRAEIQEEEAGCGRRRFKKEDSEIEAEMLTGRAILDTAGSWAVSRRQMLRAAFPRCARSCRSSTLWRKEPSAPAMLRAGVFRFVCRPRFVETESRERKNATREAPRIIADCSFRSVVFS
jgi:hypothetical protein